MYEYKYRAICHTPCYWLETLWAVGEVYEGDIIPIKHFNESGKLKEDAPPKDAGTDRRSNKQLKAELELMGFKPPSGWNRKQLWKKLHEMEMMVSKDELTNPSEDSIKPQRKK